MLGPYDHKCGFKLNFFGVFWILNHLGSKWINMGHVDQASRLGQKWIDLKLRRA